MPSKDRDDSQPGETGAETRPFTIFFVDPQTPEEVRTDTIMAVDGDDAMTIAGRRHRTGVVLHARPIGEGDFSTACDNHAVGPASGGNQFPCARFINGEFHPATFVDDQLLEALIE